MSQSILKTAFTNPDLELEYRPRSAGEEANSRGLVASNVKMPSQPELAFNEEFERLLSLV